jgi:hypothetical protein
MTTVRKDGYVRRTFDDYVQWIPQHSEEKFFFNYCVARLPFAPGYHMCAFDYDYTGRVYTKILSSHKTLQEPLDIVRVLEGGYA